MKIQKTRIIGTRVYYYGNLGNSDHLGTITSAMKGGWVEITPDSGSKPYTFPVCLISDVDRGDGTTRLVTEEAYEKRCEALTEGCEV